MVPDASMENPGGKSRLRIKSLMVTIAVLALGFGLLAQTARTSREHHESEVRFASWIAELQKANPSLTSGGTSIKASSNLFEITRDCTYTFLTPLRKSTPVRKSVTIRATFRTGPFSSVNQVTFDADGRTVTWPFVDIRRGRKIDLKAEFPETFR